MLSKSYLPLLALGAARQVIAACDDPGSDANANRMNLVEGETVMYVCSQGYQTVQYQPTITLQCMDGGVWGPVNPPSMSPVCIPDDVTTDANEAETTAASLPCKDPGLVDNADRWFTDFEEGGITYFSCKADYCVEHGRSRTVEMECRNGKWSQDPEKIKCVPCIPCQPPSGAELEQKKISMHINTDFTAKVTCDEYYVIQAGTSITDGTLECIEKGVWSPEIPTCSLKPQVVCGANEISIIINKNMLDSLGFTGGVNSLAMTGLNANTEIIMRDCQPILDDAELNYSFHIQSPYAGKCMTHFEHHMVDGLGNEANDYVFRNKIVWRQNSGAIMRSATILDWTCEYEGLFTTGLDGPIKLALSTRTYVDKRRGYKQQEFTVSMGIYANKNFTNLLESSQVVHRGKRYFVAVWLHEEEKGTPFLASCYGSPNEVSQEELIKIGRQPEPESQIRELITEGCPAERTLTRLELPGSTADRRFSFMYPYVSANGYNSNYMYVHCEMKLRPTGYKPNCVRPSSATAGSGLGGLTDDSGTKLGVNQFFNRNYKGRSGPGTGPQRASSGIQGDLQSWLSIKDNYNNQGFKSYLDNSWKPFDNKENEQHPSTIEELNQKLNGQNIPQGFGYKSGGAQGGNQGSESNPYAVFAGRRRKRRSADEGYPVSIGPMIMVTDEDVDPEDIKEITIQTKLPMKANPDGTIDLDISQDPKQETYEFKYNTTYKSRDDDIVKFKKLLPADRYVEKFDEIPGKIEWASEKQSQEEKDALLEERIEDTIMAENIEEEIQEEEEEEAEGFAVRAVIIIASFLVGGIILFAVAMFITMHTSICVGSDTKAKAKAAGDNKRKTRSKPSVPAVVVAGPATDEKELNKSCGSSLTSQET